MKVKTQHAVLTHLSISGLHLFLPCFFFNHGKSLLTISISNQHLNPLL